MCAWWTAARLLLAVPIIATAVAALPGCSSKGPQYPEDHARFTKIDAAVESLRKAYTERDLAAITALALPNETLDRLERDVQNDFRQFQSIGLQFAIERIVIEADNIDVFVHWQGHWRRHAEDPGVHERGHGVLRWVGMQSILLQGLEGDLPFGMAGRAAEPAPSSGRTS
jgi:predicted small lipoprotein YifL